MRLRAALAAVAALLLASAPAAGYPNPGLVAGDPVIHDPTMLVRPDDAPRYVVYGTHNQTLVSEDRITFFSGGPWFAVPPDWWPDDPTSNLEWAPDVSFHDGKYWLYYAVSAGIGSHTSSIGLATSTTGLPGSWTDHGAPIFSSTSSDDYNAIDPNLLVDASGNWWLTFGSWWSGIYQMPLNSQTGLPATTPATLTQLAQRTRVNPGPNNPGSGIEAPFIYAARDRTGTLYYYLFLSYDQCCKAPWDYKIYAGRSSAPNGPYADDATRPMVTPNHLATEPAPPLAGKLVLAGHDPYIAPGGQSVVHDDYFSSHDLLVYHYRDNRLLQQPFLGINFLDFSSGWPVVY